MTQIDSITIGDIVTLQRGTTYKSPLLGQPGPVLLGLATIERDGGFRDDSLVTYGGDSPDKLLLRPGDLYISLKDVTQSGDLLGAVARLPKSVACGRLTQDTAKLIFKRQSVSPSYLYWLLRTPTYRRYCRERGIGTTNLALSREDFLHYPIPPETSARVKVVALLDAIERKIDLNHKMNRTLEAMAKALFKSWFVDFDPVVAKREGRQPFGMDSLTATLFPAHFQESSLGPIPEGWMVSTVGEHFDVTMGQSPPGSTLNDVAQGLPFFQGRTDFGFRFPSRRIFTTAPSRVAEVGDVLVSVRAPVGDVNVASERCCLGRGLAGVRHRVGLKSYGLYLMKSLEDEFSVFEGQGTLFGSIGGEAFRSLQFVNPGPELVASFESYVCNMDDLVRSNSAENEMLSSMRNFLLPKLLSGQIELESAEKSVADVV